MISLASQYINNTRSFKEISPMELLVIAVVISSVTGCDDEKTVESSWYCAYIVS